MLHPPDYFPAIAKQSQQRWQKLELDPGLKGPWDRLFQQVQQPDHVISELLQNADDAKATWVKIEATKTEFIFEHNGEDFDESGLRAISSFANSNKSVLHTIGQWGIGFKSVFSLGDRVEIFTPSLAFAFDSARYIIPQWLYNAEPIEHTRIRILLKGEREHAMVEGQVKRWKEDVIPLLFFNNIRTIEIEEEKYSFDIKPGPTPQSQWVIDNSGVDPKSLLRIQIEVLYTDMPDDVKQDIRRQLPGNQEFPVDTSFVISLVAGKLKSKKIYVVLPTNQRVTSLPCTLNAPFIQDPGRTGILSPQQSPANQWFMEQLGALTANTLQYWLQNDALSLEVRARAYEYLLPERRNPEKEAGDADFVYPFLQAFTKVWNSVTTSHFLDTSGSLTFAENCVDIPLSFFDVWDKEELVAIFTDENNMIIAPQVSVSSRIRLAHWHPNWKHRSIKDVLETLDLKRPTRPRSWAQLAQLWRLAASTLKEYKFWVPWPGTKWALFPVQGKSHLFPSTEVLPPLGEKEKQFNDSEMALLLSWVNLIDKSWWQYLKNLAESDQAQAVQKALELPEATTKEPLFNTAVKAFFKQKSWDKIDGLRWAWIAARMDIPLPEKSFFYLCRDREWRSPSETELLDNISPELENIFSNEWLNTHMLHDDYWAKMPNEYRFAWENWLSISNKSRLQGFIRIKKINYFLTIPRNEFEQFCRQYGGHPPMEYPRQKDEFVIVDYDFDKTLWQHWENEGQQHTLIWSDILQYILKDWKDGSWKNLLYAEAVYQYSIRNQNRLDVGSLYSEWIMRLRDKPCVLDEHSKPRLPHEVYLRNRETVALEGTVTFLHPKFDQIEYKALYKALGIPSEPKDVQVFLDRLRTLAKFPHPPLGEVGKLYDRIALIYPNLQRVEQQQLIKTFQEEPLLLGQDGSWNQASDIYQENPDNLPGIVTLHPDLPPLFSLWYQLGIAEKPIWQTILDWLQQLPEDKILEVTIKTRLRQILKARTQQVLRDTKHWLNGQDKWVPIEQLQYTGTEKDLKHLFSHQRRQCANVGMLNPEQVQIFPQPSLAQVLEYRPQFKTKIYDAAPPKWLQSLAQFLGRVDLEDEEENERANKLSQRLANTSLQEIPKLQVVAYLQGEPAGTPFDKTVLWHQEILYYTAKATYEDITNEVQKGFPYDLQKAIHAMWKRNPKEIERYFIQEYTLSEINIPIKTQPPTEAISVEQQPQPETTEQEEHIVLPVQPIPSPKESVPAASTVKISSQQEKESSHHTPTSATPPPIRLSPWERLWQTQGFISQNDSIWINPATGERVQRKRQEAFHWVKYGSGGFATARYWGNRGSLESGIEIPFETWKLFQEDPKKTYLVLWEGEQVTKLSGVTLQAKIDAGEINIFPAAYRLRALSK